MSAHEARALTILYRGPLASCNYGCWYCPFAKRRERAADRRADREALERFAGWVAGRESDRLALFFTPWGEALARRRYRDAIAHLTQMAHVTKVAVQTNLSCGLGWLARCDLGKLGLWATYHPAEVERERFLGKCRELIACGARFSVGMVGVRENFAEIEAVRRALPDSVYLWINAYKHGADYYAPEDVARLTAIDPLFPFNNRRHPSRGRACRCGERVISVNGAGDVRRCHFVPEIAGNIYAEDVTSLLRASPCPAERCGCHIGYVHMPHLGLEEIFGEGILERVPKLDVGW